MSCAYPILMTTIHYIITKGMAINGFLSTSLSNLERRFDFTSTQTGVIAATYDIGYVLTVILVTYYGGIGHKGRWLGNYDKLVYHLFLF